MAKAFARLPSGKRVEYDTEEGLKAFVDGRLVFQIPPEPKAVPQAKAPAAPAPDSLAGRAREAAREQANKYQNGFPSPLLDLVVELAGHIDALEAAKK